MACYDNNMMADSGGRLAWHELGSRHFVKPTTTERALRSRTSGSWWRLAHEGSSPQDGPLSGSGVHSRSGRRSVREFGSLGSPREIPSW